MILVRLYADALIQLRITYYELARNHLTRTNPCHPDLPGIVLTINTLKARLYRWTP
ncbi:MAG: hypothetical protein Q7U48_13715 [Hydrogenophaga sp.]|nr:hypothetical protein [Hydrogenophaga sp.]